MSTKYPVMTLCYKCAHVSNFGFRDFFENDRDFELTKEIEMIIEELMDKETTEERKIKLFEAIVTVSTFRPDVIKYFSEEKIIKSIGEKAFAYALTNFHTRGYGLTDIIDNILFFDRKEILFILKEYLENRNLEDLDTLSIFKLSNDISFWKELFNSLNDRGKIVLMYTPIYSLRGFFNYSFQINETAKSVRTFLSGHKNSLQRVFNIFSDDLMKTEVNEIIELCKDKKKHSLITNHGISINELSNFAISTLTHFALGNTTNNLHYLDFIFSKIEDFDNKTKPQRKFFILNEKENEYGNKVFDLLEKHFKNNSDIIQKLRDEQTNFNFNNLSFKAKLDFFNLLNSYEDDDKKFYLLSELLRNFHDEKIIDEIPLEIKELFELNIAY